MKITNNSQRTEGFHATTGFVQIRAGETRDLDLSEASLKLAKRLPYLGIEGVDRGSAMQHAKTGDAPKSEPAAGSGYAIRDKGRGWFVVTHDGQDMTKSLREEDVSGFDEFSDADKAAFVEANKAED